MKSWPSKAQLLSGAALVGLLVAIPALSQESPESLLPPGFGDPQNLPPPVPKAPPPPPPRAGPPVEPSPAVQETPSLEEGEELDELDRPRPTNYFTIPEGTARGVDAVGPLEPGNFGLGHNAFGRSHGLFLATLIQRLDAPLPSRWTSILLRRALLSRVAAPRGVNPVDWVAVRADLLLRMGEADAARLLVQAIDREYYTPRMVGVAAETALATSDPAGLCPLVEPADSREVVWMLAEAMCAALEGEPARASALADQARRQGDITGIDFQLAEKVIGAGAQSRRAVDLEWDQVSALNPWRFGLASATGTELPGPVVERTAPYIRAWLARAPMIPLDQRLGAASVAAALGVFSSRSLVDIYSLILDQTDAAEAAGTVGARLRTAWVDRDVGDRLEALRSLWRDGETPLDLYARRILTAGAAARIPPSEDRIADAADLIASMLSAGMDRRAGRWSAAVQESGGDLAWALLAVGAPRPPELNLDRFESFVDNDSSAGRRRSQLLVAALAGLGRIDAEASARLASGTGLDLDGADAWSAAIDRAARDREPGTVALLAAVGMQTGGWDGVPPRYLFRIARALRAVGHEYEARMIAAEAVARL